MACEGVPWLGSSLRTLSPQSRVEQRFLVSTTGRKDHGGECEQHIDGVSSTISSHKAKERPLHLSRFVVKTTSHGECYDS